jgi:hypothetical protein|tara:strand:- start:86 stop:424 length:339 start_codon:yes stop_codon:yes gene_type:complete
LTIAIKRARHLALLPYAPHHLRVTGQVAVSSKISEDAIDGSEESNETAESTEKTQVDLEPSVTDSDQDSESETPATTTEAKLDDEDQEDSDNSEHESEETPNVESAGSEEDK